MPNGRAQSAARAGLASSLRSPLSCVTPGERLLGHTGRWFCCLSQAPGPRGTGLRWVRRPGLLLPTRGPQEPEGGAPLSPGRLWEWAGRRLWAPPPGLFSLDDLSCKPQMSRAGGPAHPCPPRPAHRCLCRPLPFRLGHRGAGGHAGPRPVSCERVTSSRHRLPEPAAAAGSRRLGFKGHRGQL